MRLTTLSLLVLTMGCSSKGTLNVDRPDGAPDASTDTAASDLAAAEAGATEGGTTEGGAVDLAADRVATPEAGTETGVPPLRGWVVRATLTQDGAGAIPVPGGMLPATDTFSIYMDGNRLIASRSGTVGSAPLRPSPDGWKTTGAFRVGATGGYLGGPCSGFGAFSYEEMELISEASNLHGSFKGGADYLSGDVVVRIPFKGTFTATPDREPPTFTVQPAKLHPADGLSVRFSEALPADTTVSLVAPDGTRRMFTAASDPGQPRASFGLSSPAGILSGHKLAIEPVLRDLAGNVAPELPSPPVETVAIPLVPEDGFEGATTPYLTGAAQVGNTGLPAIAGQRSLLFPMSGYGSSGGPGRATLRLAVAPGDKVVRATIRLVMSIQSFEPATLPFKIIRDTTITQVGPIKPIGAVARVGTIFVSEPQPLEIPLPAGTAPEILIDLDRQLFCGPLPPMPGVLIDDLRVE